MVSQNLPANGSRYAPHWLTSVAIFLLGALALVIPSGYSLGAVVLFLAGVGLLIMRRLPQLTVQDRWVIATLVAYALVSLAEAWWDAQGSRGIDKPIRFILAVPAMWWVIAYPPKLAFLWGGIAVGAISAGSWAGWQKLVEGVARAGGHTHVIQFGNLSMLLGVLCLAGLGWAAVQRQRNVWVAFMLLGAMGGILGSLFSGSRGGWVGFPIVLLVLYRAYGAGFSPKLKVAAISAVLIGGVAVYAVPQLGVQSRVHQAFNDVSLYISGESRSTSVGSRFEMWRGATLLIQEKPLIGWGSNGYEQAMAALGEEGVIDQEAASYGHAHNEFIDAFAKRGLIGLFVLLALYIIPMRLFARQIGADNLAIRSIATAGVLLPVTYIDFGLSQAFLTHNSGVMMYAFLLASFWGVYANLTREASHTKSQS
ncbi:O-antigen ligase family protein [Halomonas sp. KG2]|uniref:O-antigen ligase family protein n=1 Tax=Halomonas sp. KG2 TaxID=2951138 RepID=UPI0026496AA9|nr:O-antigen ligase [Halomonas sp. KG2]WKD27076.1 O-antigen ligase family protein [Halomonas sp. KG2]